MEKLYKTVDGQRVEVINEELKKLKDEWLEEGKRKERDKYKLDRRNDYAEKEMEEQFDELCKGLSEIKTLADIRKLSIVEWRENIKKKFPKPKD